MLSCFSHVQFFATLRTVAWQAPLSMEFSRQEYWSRQSLVSPRDLPNPGIEPGSPALQVDFYHLSHQGSSEDRQPSRKTIQNNDSEDDPGSWEKNGEDARNVYQRSIRTKEQTKMNSTLKGINSRIIKAKE